MSKITQGVAWDKSYELGNLAVDRQHKRLFELVGNLIDYCVEGKDTEMLHETLDFLASYTVFHFQYEEDLQLKYDYPDYYNHRQLHEDFRETVGALVKRYKENGSSEELSNDVNKIIVKWLINHIQKEDKKIGAHIQKMEG